MDDLKDLNYTADQFLRYAYPEIKKENNGPIPAYRYLAEAQERYPQIRAEIPCKFDQLTTETNRNNRHSTNRYHSIVDLWEDLKSNEAKAYRVMCSLPEEKMDADFLGKILQEMFTKDPDALEHFTGNKRVDVKRLIRMYDYLKWGKK